MTLQDATHVAQVVTLADQWSRFGHGCPTCVQHLVRELNRVFPAWRWVFSEKDGWSTVVVEESHAARSV